jgi:MFS family permease
MKQNIALLKWHTFFTDLIFYAPVAILYFQQISGSFALGMTIFSIVTLSSALLEVPTGIFSDRIGRKKTVIFGSLAAVFAAVFYALGQSFFMLAVGSIFSGLSRALYSGNNDALLYDTLAENKEVDNFADFSGKISRMSQIALATSALFATVVLFKGHLQGLVWLSIIPQIICLFISIFLTEPNVITNKTGNIYSDLKEAYQGFLRSEKLRLLSISSILGNGFGEASYQFQAAFYQLVWPVWAIPLAKVISNTSAAIGFHLAGPLIKKFNTVKLLVIDNLTSRMLNSIAVIFPSVLSPILMSGTSFMYGIAVTGRGALMQKEFTNEQRATMGSLNSFAGSLFFALVAFTLGLVADKLTPAKAILILQAFQLINIFIYLRLFKRNLHN